MCWNEYALRCNLVHFETQFWDVTVAVSLDREYLLHVHWPRRVWMIFPIQLLIHCNDNNILGGEAGHFLFCFFFFFGGGSFYPSNTLDRILERRGSKAGMAARSLRHWIPTAFGLLRPLKISLIYYIELSAEEANPIPLILFYLVKHFSLLTRDTKSSGFPANKSAWSLIWRSRYRTSSWSPKWRLNQTHCGAPGR